MISVLRMIVVGLLFTVALGAQAQRIPDSSVTGTARATVGIDPKIIPNIPTADGGGVAGSMCGSMYQAKGGYYVNTVTCQGKYINQVLNHKYYYVNPAMTYVKTISKFICGGNAYGNGNCWRYTPQYSFSFTASCDVITNTTNPGVTTTCPANYLTTYTDSVVFKQQFETTTHHYAGYNDTIIYSYDYYVANASSFITTYTDEIRTCPSGYQVVMTAGPFSTSSGNDDAAVGLYSCVKT